MMSMKGDGKPVSLHRGLRGAARASRRLHRRDHRALRPARHARHLVRARLGRLPARAPDPQHEGGGRRPRDAGDRRGGLRPGARASRARIRASTATASRARSSTSGCSGRGSCAPSRRSRTASIPAGRLNPGKIVRPLRDGRPRAAALRRRATRRPSRCETALDWSEWGGFGGAVEMCNNNGTCRKTVGRRDVPVLPRHAGRAARHPRPRQLAAARDLRPARAGRLHLARDEGDARPLRLLQGLPPRMPDRRRHGQDEDRVPAPLPRPPRPAAAASG